MLLSIHYQVPSPTVCQEAHEVVEINVMIIRMRTEIPARDKHKLEIIQDNK